jgi:hypothetical protein
MSSRCHGGDPPILKSAQPAPEAPGKMERAGVNVRVGHKALFSAQPGSNMQMEESA